MGRLGKIGRLPQVIRDEASRRLRKGDPQDQVADWLNSLPEVQALLANEFGGRPIRQQNLTNWKNGGYRHEELERRLLWEARRLASDGGELAAAAEGQLTDHLATVLAAHYAVELAQWNGQVDQQSGQQLRALHRWCQDIASLRRGDHGVLRLKLDEERRALKAQKKLPSASAAAAASNPGESAATR